MDNKRKALGTGLEQLFNNQTLDMDNIEKKIIEETNPKDIVDINLNELRNNPYQPRQNFDEEKLNELAASIKEYGVFQPIIVKKSIKGYEIVAGERRTRASLIAGKKTIPAIIKDFSENQMMEIALLENIQREDLNAVEEAKAFMKIIKKLDITQEELSKKIGKSRSYITNTLGLLRLPREAQQEIIKGNISMAHAKILSKLDEEEEILKYLKEIKNKNLSVRELENLISKGNIKRKHEGNYSKERKYSNVEHIMRMKIGTMVKITGKNIEIPYDSEMDLERILNILNIEIDKE